jgi:hypothetical protein
MRTIYVGLLLSVSLLGQGSVEAILECVENVSKAGMTRIAAPVPAGSTILSFTQPLPLGLVVVLNPGGANQETMRLYEWRTLTPPYEAEMSASSSNFRGVPTTFAHSAGELVAINSEESTAYFGYFNVQTTPVTFPVGSGNNFFFPGNPNQEQPSTFQPGIHRYAFGAAMKIDQDLLWALDGAGRSARRDPALACNYGAPQVKGENIAIAPGTSLAGLRLGTVTGGSPGPLTLGVQRVYHHGLSASGVPATTTELQFTNLRLQNGVIFGDVTASARALYRHYFFILSVADSSGRRGMSTGVADVVGQCAMTVTPPVLSNAYVNTPYSVNFGATGVQGPITFEVEGTLPVGLSMTEAGLLSGTPLQAGSFPLAIRSAAIDGCFARTPLTLEVQGQLCAANVTPLVEITLGGFRQNLVTRRWPQTVTLRNGGQSSIFGPVALVADSLSANAAMTNSGGTTACAAPLGRPYVVAGLGPNNLLAPGGTVAIALEFTNSSTAPITYTPRVIAGGAIR